LILNTDVDFEDAFTPPGFDDRGNARNAWDTAAALDPYGSGRFSAPTLQSPYSRPASANAMDMRGFYGGAERQPFYSPGMESAGNGYNGSPYDYGRDPRYRQPSAYSPQQ
jgi:hypothetical protein